jgi:poly(3-hydroxybutyrate) depolymerase
MAGAKARCLAALVAFTLAACGGGSSTGETANTSGSPGSLIFNPPLRIASVTAADFTASLATTASGRQLLTLLRSAAILPVCGIDFHYIQYNTVGGAGEPTTASGALMVPTGLPLVCTGKRPIVLYSHGTAFTRSYDIANPADPTNEASNESTLIAAAFAAQGYIVVSSNYAGYDTSSLPYHPFINGDQQSEDMINALAAARQALGHIAAATTLDSGKLFVTGYSQGGYVAMATYRALLNAGMPVAAAAPMSGPYALEAFGDTILLGTVDLSATGFFPLVTTSYQRAYGKIYNATTDFYALPYANGIESVLPSTRPLGTGIALGQSPLQELIAQGVLPLAAFDSSTPMTGNAQLDAELAVPASPPFASVGFGNPYLVNNSVRVAWALDVNASPDGALPPPPGTAPPPGAPLASNPMFPLRQDLKRNDLRNPLWAPRSPMLLCGGGQDPTVFFLNTKIMNAFWQPLNLPAGLVTTLDVDLTTATAQDSPLPFVPLQLGFTAAYDALVAAEGSSKAVTQYHVAVAPFCTVAAAGFFRNF